MAMRRVGFVGLGAIGEPMASRVLEAGFELHVWNRDAAKTHSLVRSGAKAAASPAALAARVDMVMTCVTDGDALEQVLLGATGLLEGAGPGLLVADLSTIHPDQARRLAAQVEHAGARWLDVPVSGGVPGARAGTLSVFAGGEATDVDAARPVLAAFAQRVTHLGGPGAGQTAKICNQMVSFATCAALGEALLLAARLGLDVARLPDAMQGGLADSAVLRAYAPDMLAGVFRGNSLVALKDLEIAQDLARSSGTGTPMGTLLTSLHRRVVAGGHTRLGMAGPLRLHTDEALMDLAERRRAEADGTCR